MASPTNLETVREKVQALKDIENAKNGLDELEKMVPPHLLLMIRMKSEQAIADYLKHGEGGRLALLHLALTVNHKICRDEL